MTYQAQEEPVGCVALSLCSVVEHPCGWDPVRAPAATTVDKTPQAPGEVDVTHKRSHRGGQSSNGQEAVAPRRAGAAREGVRAQAGGSRLPGTGWRAVRWPRLQALAGGGHGPDALKVTPVCQVEGGLEGSRLRP